MPTLQGKWYFKETLDLASIETPFSYSTYVDDPDIVYGQPFFRSGGREYTAIWFENSSATNAVSYGTDELFPYNPGYGWHDSRDIEFLYPIKIDEDFYNWFTKNAVNLQPTGTWRFNKTLTSPKSLDGDSSVTTYYEGANYELHDYEIPFCTIHGINVDAYMLTADWSDYGYYCLQAGTGLVKYLYKANEQTWTSEEAREITFNNNLECLDPYFALWFYENAHSMELKLYSECYIAEAVDTIRSITGATKGYTVKDLSAGIEEVKQSAVNYTGNTWTFRDDIDSEEYCNYVAANGNATSYGACLAFDINFTVPEGCVFDGDDGEKTDTVYTFASMEFYANDGDEGDCMYYFPSDDSISASLYYVGEAGVFEQGATIKLEEEPSAELLAFLNTFATEVGNSECKHQQKSVTPQATATMVLPDSGYNALSAIIINGDNNLTAANVKKDVTIFGVTGTYEGDNDCAHQAKTVNPSASTQTVTPDSGYDGLSSVTVNPCSGTTYISSTASVSVVGKASARISSTERNKIIPSNIKSGVNILGVTGTYTNQPTLSNVTITCSNSTDSIVQYNWAYVDGDHNTITSGTSIGIDGWISEVLSVPQGSILVTWTQYGSGDHSLVDDGGLSTIVGPFSDSSGHLVTVYRVNDLNCFIDDKFSND